MVLLFAIHASLAAGPEVVLSRDLYVRMLEADDEDPVEPPAPAVVNRDLIVVMNRKNLLAIATWDVSVRKAGWVDLPLITGPWHILDVRVDGQPADVVTVNGVTRLVRELTADTRIELRAQRPGTARTGDRLTFMGAASGTVEIRTNDDVQRLVADEPIVRVGDRWWTGTSSFTLTTEAERPERRKGQEVVGAVGIGVTVGDDAMRVGARVAYRITTGSLSTVSFDLVGAGADLEITGPLVKRWDRRGDRVDVELSRAETRLVELDVRMSAALPDDDQVTIQVPTIRPQGTYRTEQAIQLARDGDREIAPQMKGWTAVATSELPTVARGLVDGTPTSAWTASQAEGAALNLLRFEPVSGPPTFVDVAAWYGATSREGRTLLRGHLTVRNDRGDFLRMKLAPGQRLVSARVGDEPARVARDGDTLLLPLLKSLETVEGLLDFPVHVVILAEGDAFERNEDRVVRWPVVDAPIAVSRVELALPIGWESRLERGEQHVVGRFSEGDGISYGFSANNGKVELADRLYQQALSSYMGNDFEDAQVALDGLRELGGSNDNVSRLQSNLDVVLGGAESDAQLGRRVKDQARARAVEDERKQVELQEEADDLLNAGDYEAAEQVYGEALAIGQKLEKLEQEESREVQQSNLVVEKKLAKAKKAKSKRPAPPKSAYKERTEIDFEGVDVAGELVKPQGQLTLDRRAPTVDDGEPPVPVESSDAPTKEFLSRVPSGRSYQMAASLAVGGRAGGSDAYGGGADIAAPSPPAGPVPPPVMEMREVQVHARSGRRILPFGKGGAGPRTMLVPVPIAPSAPPAPPPAVVAAFGPLDVTAASRDIVVPTFGEVVRYQHLILPSGAAPAVRIVAKAKRGTR